MRVDIHQCAHGNCIPACAYDCVIQNEIKAILICPHASCIPCSQGGLVLVSHNFRLIDQVAQHIWVCDKGEVVPWKGTIREYKAMLAKKMGIASI
jgi:ABC-type dipeptide/oligopeptide/nickel transport system ATPase subunit